MIKMRVDYAKHNRNPRYRLGVLYNVENSVEAMKDAIVAEDLEKIRILYPRVCDDKTRNLVLIEDEPLPDNVQSVTEQFVAFAMKNNKLKATSLLSELSNRKKDLPHHRHGFKIIEANVIDLLALHNNLTVLRWIYEHPLNEIKITCQTFCTAAYSGIEMLTYVSQFVTDEEISVLNGPDFLHGSRSNFLYSMIASKGDLDVIKLLDSRNVKCTSTGPMSEAAGNGHLDVVKWLHACVEIQGYTTRAMNCAAESGHLDVVKWLHENRTEGCDEDAILWALSRNHKDVIEFLVKNNCVKVQGNGLKNFVRDRQSYYGYISPHEPFGHAIDIYVLETYPEKISEILKDARPSKFTEFCKNFLEAKIPH